MTKTDCLIAAVSAELRRREATVEAGGFQRVVLEVFLNDGGFAYKLLFEPKFETKLTGDRRHN